MKTTPKVGDTLYSLNIGNVNRRGTEQKLTSVTVCAVGRKYFTCHPVDHSFFKTQYHLEDWREKTDYSPQSKIYTNQQEWEDEKESGEICHIIAEAFSHWGNRKKLPLSDLREIRAILTKYDEPQPGTPR